MKIKFKLTKRRIFLLIPVIILVFVFLYLGINVSQSLPAFNPAKLETDKTTFVYDKGGNIIAALHAEENRVPIPLNEIPENLRNAFIATEDARFYEHHGVDLKAIVRATVVNLERGETTEGGSTITQQLIKNSFLKPDRTLKRKFQEAYLAIKMERQYTKDEIIEMYLNRIYFGHGAYGVQTAAQVYFGKKAADLDLAECAMLTGIPKNPNRYSPYLDLSRARERQKVVLDLMVKAKYISSKQAEQARNEPLKFIGLKNNEDVKFLDYVDCVIEEAQSKCAITSDQIYRGGIKIYTNLDKQMQSATEAVYNDDSNFPQWKTDQIVQSGITILDPHTGEIKAMMGGRKQSILRGRNRATDPVGQPGSTFKPIAVYGPALELKVSPNTIIVDKPVTFANKYSPKNADWTYMGPVSIREAVARSRNVVAVRLLDKIGIEEGFKFAKKLGFKQLTDNDKGLSLALGGTHEWVSPLQMATAYGAFDNKGILVEPYTIAKITDANDKVLYTAKPGITQVMSEQTAHVMTELLEGVVQGGTGTKARLGRPVAGKTGTTELDGKEFGGLRGNRDTWFVGYTPELVAAVWVGYDKTDREHYMYSYGGDYPAVIWRTVMAKVLADIPVKDFERNYNYNGFTFKYSEKVEEPPAPPSPPPAPPAPPPTPPATPAPATPPEEG